MGFRSVASGWMWVVGGGGGLILASRVCRHLPFRLPPVLCPQEGKPRAENEYPSSVAVFFWSAFTNTS